MRGWFSGFLWSERIACDAGLTFITSFRELRITTDNSAETGISPLHFHLHFYFFPPPKTPTLSVSFQQRSYKVITMHLFFLSPGVNSDLLQTKVQQLNPPFRATANRIPNDIQGLREKEQKDQRMVQWFPVVRKNRLRCRVDIYYVIEVAPDHDG
ncbi:hypothetical protein CDAR_617611 [Caerostris darwini]|uniref:Uncharacterized protein n=1 Tax=Caerostris darwini TaxID=1538125 RepID=A0AAV4VRZ8_9ARAC|nr:hypothetical protein CDAR_617611 [Caerostris darwini]